MADISYSVTGEHDTRRGGTRGTVMKNFDHSTSFSPKSNKIIQKIVPIKTRLVKIKKIEIFQHVSEIVGETVEFCLM